MFSATFKKLKTENNKIIISFFLAILALYTYYFSICSPYTEYTIRFTIAFCDLNIPQNLHDFCQILKEYKGIRLNINHSIIIYLISQLLFDLLNKFLHKPVLSSTPIQHLKLFLALTSIVCITFVLFVTTPLIFKKIKSYFL